MPLYEFRCPTGHDFEKFYRSISSAPSEEKCPECGLMAERVMSAAGLVFKGSGFYITDYGKDGKKQEQQQQKAAAEATAAKPADAAAPAAKTEAKPAATESKPASAPKKAE
jgi:putative FmdB family regulatory protein